MKIQLNGQEADIVDGTTIGELIRSKELDPKTVVVEHNGLIVTDVDWDEIVLAENDSLEVLNFVGGG